MEHLLRDLKNASTSTLATRVSRPAVRGTVVFASARRCTQLTVLGHVRMLSPRRNRLSTVSCDQRWLFDGEGSVNLALSWVQQTILNDRTLRGLL